jgi:hypothetical protein
VDGCHEGGKGKVKGAMGKREMKTLEQFMIDEVLPTIDKYWEEELEATVWVLKYWERMEESADRRCCLE